MPDAAKLPAFLIHYIAECDREGINPLLVGNLAASVELMASLDAGLTTDAQGIS